MSNKGLRPRAEFFLQYLDLEEATQVPDARWEPYQLQLIGSDDLFSIMNKSRQIAFSFSSAAKAIGRAVLEAESSVFVSINREEAAEKIVYAERIYETLNKRIKLPKLVNASKSLLKFDNGARILSHPSKPPRGKSRFHVTLDEFAHLYYKDAIDVYRGSLPIISKGGTLAIGSSPLDANGMFWELFTETYQKYPQYTRKQVPWYLSLYFCKDPQGALKAARSGMDDVRLVRKFGTDRIIMLFESMQLEDFQVEYCCKFIDGSTSWITNEEILSCVDRELDLPHLRADSVESVQQVVRELDQLFSRRTFEGGVLVGAMDIGRRRDTSEIWLLRANIDIRTARVMFTPLVTITLRNVQFDRQWDVLERVLVLRNLRKFLIDSTGLGMSLAEKAGMLYATKVEEVTFTAGNKIQWSVDVRKAFQQKCIVLPPWKALVYQINSIKRRVGNSNNVLLDAERTEKSHADSYWALAMAVSAGYQISTISDFATSVGQYVTRASGLMLPPVKINSIPQHLRSISIAPSRQAGVELKRRIPLIGLRGG